MKQTCKKYLQKADKGIRNFDSSYKSSYKYIHFDDDDQKKTYIGALLTVVVFGYVAFIGYVKA